MKPFEAEYYIKSQEDIEKMRMGMPESEFDPDGPTRLGTFANVDVVMPHNKYGNVTLIVVSGLEFWVKGNYQQIKYLVSLK